MDAEFVQATARVGDAVEVRLITGDLLVGNLIELTLSRLTLLQADGGRAAILLSALVMIKAVARERVFDAGSPPASTAVSSAALPAVPPPAPHPVALALALSGTASSAAASAGAAAQAASTTAEDLTDDAVMISSRAPMEAVDETPPAAAPDDPGQQRAEPEAETDSGVLAGSFDSLDSAAVDEGVAFEQSPEWDESGGDLAAATPGAATEPSGMTDHITIKMAGGSDSAGRQAVAALPITIAFDFATYNIVELEAIEQSFKHAQRVNELHPRHHRTKDLLQRARKLLYQERDNGELYRLVGILALLDGQPDAAQESMAIAAHILGDAASFRGLAIAAANAGDSQTTIWALLRYFRITSPADDVETWPAFLMALDEGPGRSPLGEVLAASHSEVGRRLVMEALSGTRGSQLATPRPLGARPRLPVTRRPALAKSEPSIPQQAVAGRAGPQPEGGRTSRDPYRRAKHLELREKNLDAAKAAYREAISAGDRRESAVKDLAWLTKRTEGSEAALKVIDEEFPGIVQPGASLDNIYIHFYMGARRYQDALTILTGQLERAGPSRSKRSSLLHQIAYAKLADGQDCVADWSELVAFPNATSAERRGLALALIQRRGAADLAEAENLIRDDQDERADHIRERISALRKGNESTIDELEWIDGILEGIDRLDFTSALVRYVMQNFSQQASKTKEQRKREKKRVSFEDARRLASSAEQMRGTQRENSADGYISAAVIARETGREEQMQQYLCMGLTALADLVLERQSSEAARDLYCEALVAADRLDNPRNADVDVRLALTRYFRSLDRRRAALRGNRDSREELTDLVGEVILEQYALHGDHVFTLVDQLVSQTDLAGEWVIEAIYNRTTLHAGVAAHIRPHLEDDLQASTYDVMRDAWQKRADAWASQQRQAVRTLSSLPALTLSEDTLEEAINRVTAVGAEAKVTSDRDLLERLVHALQELKRFGYESSFEEREACLRTSDQTARGIRVDIGKAPTNFAVEGIEPLAVRIDELVRETSLQLLADQRPHPDITLALEQSSSDQNGLVTVQVKIANRPGMAPLETPELHIESDEQFFSAVTPVVQLPTAVRGGDHRIEAVKLVVTAAGSEAGAFSLPVVLRYRTRFTGSFESHEVSLPVRLARDGQFKKIPNPFQEGASGRPVVREEMFFGRDELLDRIEAQLRNAESPGSGVAIFGQKRAGKSSIRLHLTRRLREESGFVVVDLENIGSLQPEPGEAASRMLLAALMWMILSRTESELRARGQHGPEDSLMPPGITRADLYSQPVADGLEIIESYFVRIPEGHRPRLIVLIDEFQYFDEWMHRGELKPSFMQALKAMIERRLFHLVIVGQDALDRLISQHANVFGVFARERVTYLAELDARRLVEEPILIEDKESRYRERAIDRILELTGGSAFYIQRFCFELVEHMNFQRAPLVTEADVELVRERLISDLRSEDFENLETAGYTDPDAPTAEQYRAALLAVAGAAADGRASKDRIAAIYRGGGDVGDLLDDLVLRDVVRYEPSGTYRIVVRLYQDWLVKHHPVAR